MANTQPIFISLPQFEVVTLTNQTLTRDGITGTPAQLWMGDATNGGIIETIRLQPLGDISANVVRLFVKKANTTTYNLLLETSISAVAGSTATAAIAPTIVTLPSILFGTGNITALRVEAGDTLFCALGTASVVGINVTALGGPY